MLCALIPALAGGVYLYYARTRDDGGGFQARTMAKRYAQAWARGDIEGAWKLTTPQTHRTEPLRFFIRGHRRAFGAATLERARVLRVGQYRDGRVRVAVAATTRDFGKLQGTFSIPVVAEGIAWNPSLRLPGLTGAELVSRVVEGRGQSANVLDANGRPLIRTESAASLVTATNERFKTRLGGKPEARLKFGERVVARSRSVEPRAVRTSIEPAVQNAAMAALGDRVGGIAVIRPRDGAVLALAGLGASAPQPPGSVFKVITLAAALQTGETTPRESFPVRSAATLAGVRLRNAGDGACGGSLAQSLAKSCNSVFGPLGARLGAKRLVEYAGRFGFYEELPIPGFKKSTIARDLADDLAVGAAAIGQERDLATPLVMAGVAATIANRGVRARPWMVRGFRAGRVWVVRRRVAAEVRDMMVGVVRGGTGTGAALPGVTVAGKSGTAELVATADAAQNPNNTNAWFIAFAPAERPRVAVAVMLVRSGQGGTNAAPVARRVLQATLTL